MGFTYNDKDQRYNAYIDCGNVEFCDCNEKIIQLFNNSSICEMDSLEIFGLEHIEYNRINDKINNKLHVKELNIYLSAEPYYKKILNLSVLELLFYSDEIEKLIIEYNQTFYFGEILFKNLKYLSITVFCDKMPALTFDEVFPLDFVLPFIIKQCPNVKELNLERTFDESLQFIIKYLIELNKNLKIKLNYEDSCCYDYRTDDEIYIEENNLKRIDKDTILYKLPNVKEEEKIYITLCAVCYRCDA